MRKLPTVLTGILMIVAAGPVHAKGPAEAHQEIKEIRRDTRDQTVTRATLERLSHTVDLWHDANLKDDQSLAYRYEQQLNEIILSDIGATARHLSQRAKEIKRSVRQMHCEERRWSEPMDDQASLADDTKDNEKLEMIFKTKKRLAAAIAKSEAFSNRFRLLGDYEEVLRAELGFDRQQWAEDVKELRSDR